MNLYLKKGGFYNYFHIGDNKTLFDWNCITDAYNFDIATGLAVVRLNGKMHLVDVNGKIYFDPGFDKINPEPERSPDDKTKTWFKVENSGKWNMVNAEGDYLLVEWADKVGHFYNRFNKQTQKHEAYVAYQDKTTAYVDCDGNITFAS